MLDPDISTAAALQHLHRPETDRWAVDRRRFLQLVGMGLGAGLVAGPGTSLLDAALPGHDPSAWAAGPIGPNDGVLVVFGMFGGNDGLNTVVPINDGLYYDQHDQLAIPAGSTLPLDANSGLNPALTELKRFWDVGQLAIVEGVGYPNPDLSHFNSMAYWMSGIPNGIPTSGWLGRWLDGYLSGSKDLFAAVEVGNAVPLHLVGQSSIGSVVPAGRPGFGVPREWRIEEDQRLYNTIRSMNHAPAASWQGRVGQAFADQLDMAATIAPLIPEDLPDSRLAAEAEVMARLINANLGFRVLTVGWGDFDSHAGQPDQHPLRMQEFNEAIARFFQILHPQWAGRVTVMTFSEFGRTSFDNDGLGTDHGTSAPHFVFGANVKGGFYGQRPSLAGLRRWDRMAHHVDFRDYYGSVIDGWLGGGGSDVFFGRPIQNLGLFSSPPAPSGGGGGGGAVASGDFVAVSPTRVRDTRSTQGGPKGPIGPKQTIDVQITGVGDVPATGVSAVAVNITSVNATAQTFLTAYPTGGALPPTSTVNPVLGRAVPNMAIVGLGQGGRLSVYNEAGTVDCLVDVLGYFSDVPGAQLAPMNPARLLDTRNGNGAARRRVKGGQQVDLKVLGRGGVPTDGVDAVVMNVTAVNPTSGGYVTVWPQGEARREVSALNYARNLVVPNLVVCKVGGGGGVSLFASDGEVDLLADVVGCFTTSPGSRHLAVTPARILDTRSGLGAPKARVGAGQEIDLQAAGRGGVPATAKAVIMNVTVVAPSAWTWITTYPSGEARPDASSHNADANQIVANLTVVKTGNGGRVKLYNAHGNVDLLADVTGYFI